MAQIATWAFWPRHPLQQLPALEARIASQLEAQILAMQQGLDSGGEPPAALCSQDLLPSIQRLQQLRDQNQGLPMPASGTCSIRRAKPSFSISMSCGVCRNPNGRPGGCSLPTSCSGWPHS